MGFCLVLVAKRAVGVFWSSCDLCHSLRHCIVCFVCSLELRGAIGIAMRHADGDIDIDADVDAVCHIDCKRSFRVAVTNAPTSRKSADNVRRRSQFDGTCHRSGVGGGGRHCSASRNRNLALHVPCTMYYQYACWALVPRQAQVSPMRHYVTCCRASMTTAAAAQPRGDTAARRGDRQCTAVAPGSAKTCEMRMRTSLSTSCAGVFLWIQQPWINHAVGDGAILVVTVLIVAAAASANPDVVDVGHVVVVVIGVGVVVVAAPDYTAVAVAVVVAVVVLGASRCCICSCGCCVWRLLLLRLFSCCRRHHSCRRRDCDWGCCWCVC